MADPIVFDRKPYTVTYMKDGEKHTIRRVPPEKLHQMWPEDQVQLNVKKNDDWDAGGKFTVKGINPKHPNVIQIQNSDGEATFVSYRDLELKEARGMRGNMDALDLPENNKYLIWP